MHITYYIKLHKYNYYTNWSLNQTLSTFYNSVHLNRYLFSFLKYLCHESKEYCILIRPDSSINKNAPLLLLDVIKVTVHSVTTFCMYINS